MENRIIATLAPTMSVDQIDDLIGKISNPSPEDIDNTVSDELRTLLKELASRNNHGTNMLLSNKEKNTLKKASGYTVSEFKCTLCGNRVQKNFIWDKRSGDTICLGISGNGCGNVVSGHRPDEGSAYRHFEGEEDRSHHGPAQNRLFSTQYNLKTTLSMGTADKKDSKKLNQLADNVEMNLSNLGNMERRTRTGYKDKMKKRAFDMINHTAGNLNISEAAAERAKELFAAFRNVREHIHFFDGVVAACLIQGYRELAHDTKTLLINKKINNNNNNNNNQFKESKIPDLYSDAFNKEKPKYYKEIKQWTIIDLRLFLENIENDIIGNKIISKYSIDNFLSDFTLIIKNRNKKRKISSINNIKKSFLLPKKKKRKLNNNNIKINNNNNNNNNNEINFNNEIIGSSIYLLNEAQVIKLVGNDQDIGKKLYDRIRSRIQHDEKYIEEKRIEEDKIKKQKQANSSKAWLEDDDDNNNNNNNYIINNNIEEIKI